MNPNKALWEKGDFTCIAETMRESGEDDLAKELTTLFASQNTSRNGGTSIPATFLRVTVGV